MMEMLGVKSLNYIVEACRLDFWACPQLSCNNCTVSDRKQTVNCLCQACCGVTGECEAGSHALGQQVLRPSFASWQLGWTGYRVSCASQTSAAPPVSRLKDPKIPRMHPSSMFFQTWSHCGEKNHPSSSQSSLLSQQRPTCDRKTHLKTTRCQDSFGQSVMKTFFFFFLHRVF